MLTKIFASYVRLSGFYATAYQYDENGDLEGIIQVPNSLSYVQFFHWEEKKLIEDASFALFSKDKNFVFQMDNNPIKRVPGHKTPDNAKPTEKFFVVNNTLYIDSKEVDLKISYEKTDSRNGKPSSIHETNFSLVQHLNWNHGDTFFTLLYDVQDYRLFELEVMDHIKKVAINGYFKDTTEIKECANRLNELIDTLERRINWWEEATVDDLVVFYNKQQNKNKKGGED